MDIIKLEYIMIIRESESVRLKRRGAEYVFKIISGKTEQDQLDFWKKRTSDLLKKLFCNSSKNSWH